MTTERKARELHEIHDRWLAEETDEGFIEYLARALESAQQSAAVDRARFRKAPCYLCGYNGAGYFQPETHPCAALYHAAQPGGAK